MQIYNTQSRRKEEFVPREEGKVYMYACGPTVYNYIHIGNARTFLTFDVVRRYLSFRDYEVKFVQNITDLDDKIINRAREEGKTTEEIAAFYTEAFIDAMHRFGIADPDVRPRATQEVPEMIELVERLVENGHAYEVDGDVYFSVRSWPRYGHLSGRDIDELQSGARVDVDERKRDPLDFALWKAAKPGEPYWDSPWGQGRPGWHLECSAMSQKYLGLPLDIHGGGSDLVFPHHENEAAQSEAAYGGTFANCWIHGGMLNINSEKMSKSLGNFLLLSEVLDKCDPMALRLLMLQTHYRSPLDFSYERLGEAGASYERVVTSVRNLAWAVEHAADAPETPGVAELEERIERAEADFIAAMDDDFNTAGALAAVFTLVTASNSFVEEHPQMDARARAAASAAREEIEKLAGVLGIELSPAEQEAEWPQEVCELAQRLAQRTSDDPHEAVEILLEARAQARAEKDWGTADAVRDGLAALGFTVEDTANGARVSYGA